MKNKIFAAALFAVLLVAGLAAAHQMDLIGFIKRLHGVQ